MKQLKILLITPKGHRRTAIARGDEAYECIRRTLFDPVERKSEMPDSFSVGFVTRYVNGVEYGFFYEDDFLVSGKYDLQEDVVMQSAETDGIGNPVEVFLGNVIAVALTPNGDLKSLSERQIDDFEYYLDSGDGVIVYRIRKAGTVSPASNRGGAAISPFYAASPSVGGQGNG